MLGGENIGRLPLDQPREADYGVHRGAQLVRHVGQKLRLEPVSFPDFEVCLLQFLIRRLELPGALPHLCLQCLGMLPRLLIELGVLYGNSCMIRQGAQELLILLAELVRIPAMYVEDPCHHVTRFQRHHHSGANVRFLDDLQEGTIGIFFLVITYHFRLAGCHYPPTEPFPRSDAHFGERLGYCAAIRLDREGVAILLAKRQETRFRL